MTGKGHISAGPHRRLKRILGLHAAWISMMLLLVGWWGSLLYSQAERIAELEKRVGASPEHVVEARFRARRMIVWESSALFVLLLAAAGAGLWMLFRDSRRTRELEAFFASITHELKTPLTSIRLQTEALADSGEATGRQAELLRRLLEDTGRLEGQVERMLELARLEGGGIVFLREVPVAAWLESALRPWREVHSGRLELEVNVPPNLSIRADAAALDVILRNTLENALKHGASERTKVSISAGRAADGVELTIRDDGAGFPGEPRDLGVLFRKGPSSKGTGIGLYLVTTLMARMGGSAEFDGSTGFRTRLRFSTGEAS
ncbi:MAG: HAMP domain-containing histidine kinase [Bdellovibrionales bacterium]|nr:HAMP domain-containing histidine kinase [Bdellovibrionales bacterium]